MAFDPAAIAGLVTREVRAGVRDGVATRTVVARRVYPASQADLWDALTSAGVRPVTVVAPQALLFLNSPHVRACAVGLAGRLKPAAQKGLPDAVDLPPSRARTQGRRQ